MVAAQTNVADTLTVLTIGEAVRRARLSKDWSKQELAKQAGVRPNLITDLERDKANFTADSLSKVASALGLTTAELYAMTVPNPPEVRAPGPRPDPNEERLVEAYRQLPDDKRRLLLDLADSLAPARGGRRPASGE